MIVVKVVEVVRVVRAMAPSMGLGASVEGNCF